MPSYYCKYISSSTFFFLDFAEEKMTSVSAELKGFGFDIFETTVGGEGLAVLKVD